MSKKLTRDEWEDIFNLIPLPETNTAHALELMRKLDGHDAEQRTYADFGRSLAKLLRELPGWFGDEWSEELMPLAAEAGLAERVEYDPLVHDAEEAEPGDEIWVWKEPTDDD